MSTLTMPAPQQHTGFHREFAWQETRSSEPVHQSRNNMKKIALPSIRQAFPELQLRVQHDGAARTPSSTTSPVAGPAGTMTPPEYVHSPNCSSKRRRLSFEDDREGERASQVPRLYTNPGAPMVMHQSPPSRSIPRPAQESWPSPSRTSPYLPSGALPSMQTPAPMEVRERIEARPTLPSLPRMEFDRNPAPMHRVRSQSGDEYMPESMRPRVSHPSGPSMEAPAPVYRAPNYSYGGYHPSRVQSMSVGSIHPFDRAPFSAAAAYGHHFQDSFMRMGDYGMGMGGDNKQRKRRGNLPKETTDKLRAWFVAHLHHPYPTEDEKQSLMRQTGLQMSKFTSSTELGFRRLGTNIFSSSSDQISNWFINARRRQLPTMINNARAESDAMSGRGGDGKVLPSTERADYDHSAKRNSVPLSEGEASNFDDVELDGMTRRRGSSHFKRGSI
ncbi:hypothetical protein PG996_001284 [Apiospora saccharicola]|uniref:Homeobox domain-containing protein n=1 Tax=Apiospora saccharicola TaxID=335842 RepID=A0ABR1WKE8_9PEZI